MNKQTSINVQSDSDHSGQSQTTPDHFIIRDGVEYSGTHLLIDLWGAVRLDDQQYIESVLRRCVTACNATLLHIHLHRFSDSGGISGVAVLAESHISVHTWPERNYAAFDVFMCGVATPSNAVSILTEAFEPDTITTNELLRGQKDSK
ncbi:MAG: adenosylmethionine decarboxylase [Gammaproteobacteria bacterium]|nr:adenosylmethionine decarboxylase [Gammaproteobacteria bacterium]